MVENRVRINQNRAKQAMHQIKQCNASADGLLVLANHTFVCYMAAEAGRKVGEDEWRGDTPTFDEESHTMMVIIIRVYMRRQFSFSCQCHEKGSR